jgi:hypothetical protein
MHRLCMTGTWLVELRLTCLLHRPIKRALSAAGFSPGLRWPGHAVIWPNIIELFKLCSICPRCAAQWKFPSQRLIA